MAQWVIGYEKNNDEHKYFCRAIFWIHGTKAKKLKLEDRCKLDGIPETLIPLDGTGFLIFRQVQDDYRFGGERHTHPASDHKDPNPATLAPRLLWLSTVSQSG